MTASACRYTLDGVNFCELEIGHQGSHRHSARQQPIGDGRGIAGQWVPLKMYNELREQRDEVRRLAWQLRATARRFETIVAEGPTTPEVDAARYSLLEVLEWLDEEW